MLRFKDLSFFVVQLPASQRLAAHRNGAAEMKQILQKMKTGEVTVTEVPAPVLRSGCVLVRTAASLISAGTERLTVEAGQKGLVGRAVDQPSDRKSTRLNSSHSQISYAVFCLKK